MVQIFMPFITVLTRIYKNVYFGSYSQFTDVDNIIIGSDCTTREIPMTSRVIPMTSMSVLTVKKSSLRPHWGESLKCQLKPKKVNNSPC